jgi:fatty-acyl-CoA synthase
VIAKAAVPGEEVDVLRGGMQDVALTLDLILRRADQLGGDVGVVSYEAGGRRVCTWRDVAERALRVVAALDSMRVPRNSCVATFAHNGREHLELFYGIPCGGRLLHALNTRHTPDAIRHAARQTSPVLMFVVASLTAQLAELALPVPPYGCVVIDDGADPHPSFANAPRYEQLVDAATPVAFDDLPQVEESNAASICHTSGTSGPPKGVVYSHRSMVLHALGAMTADSHAIRADDVVLPLTPMFHANGWSLPFTCGLAVAALVFAGRDTRPETVADIVAREQVNVLAGVPTFLATLAPQLEASRRPLESLQRIVCGGAKPATRVVDRFVQSGIAFMLGWGMTELSPCGTAKWTPAHGPPSTGSVGRPVAGVELRIVDADGCPLPWDGIASGELLARGPWVAGSYLGGQDPDSFTDGWLRTGDLARIEPDGTLVLVDRLKDLIKSGGEWISSQELERALQAHASVQEVAVVAVPHPRWEERPAALVVLHPPDRTLDAEALGAIVRGAVEHWQVPDAVLVVDELARTSVGKIDKRALKERHGTRLLQLVENRGATAPEIVDLRGTERA